MQAKGASAFRYGATHFFSFLSTVLPGLLLREN